MVPGLLTPPTGREAADHRRVEHFHRPFETLGAIMRPSHPLLPRSTHGSQRSHRGRGECAQPGQGRSDIGRFTEPAGDARLDERRYVPHSGGQNRKAESHGFDQRCR